MSGLSYGPERAEKLIEFMDTIDRRNGGGVLKPTVKSFTSLLDAYAQANDWNGAVQSERILNHMLDYFLENNDPDLEPNVASWTIVISAYVRIARKNQRGAAPRADKLLRRMKHLHGEGRISAAPDAIAYVTVMNGWAFSRLDNGPEKAEELLDEMNERYLDGDVSYKPSAKSMRNIVESWVRVGDSTSIRQAESFLQRYQEYVLGDTSEETRDIFRSLLFAWSKLENPYRAQDYLFEMVKRKLRPDSFSFDRVIEAYTQLNAEDSADCTKQVFDLMEECRKGGIINPNERVYTSFIRALTKAEVPNLAKKALAILNRMAELNQLGNKGIRPTVFTYNAVLNACATSASGDPGSNLDAFRTAIGVFNELRASKETLDHVTYGNMLRCAVLLPAGSQRDAMVATTFDLCCKCGFVNSFVLRDLENAVDEQLLRKLTQIPQGEVAVENLPSSWSRRFKRKR